MLTDYEFEIVVDALYAFSSEGYATNTEIETIVNKIEDLKLIAKILKNS